MIFFDIIKSKKHLEKWQGRQKILRQLSSLAEPTSKRFVETRSRMTENKIWFSIRLFGEILKYKIEQESGKQKSGKGRSKSESFFKNASSK